MTDLIIHQLRAICVMACCGIGTGLVIKAFRRVWELFPKISAVIWLMCCLSTAVLIGEFLFFCQNGRLSFTAAAAYFAGLWLWKRINGNI